MTDTGIALDFVDIALDEIENENNEVAAEFIEDAADILEDDNDYEDVYESLRESLDYLDEGENQQAFDSARHAWVTLADE